MLINGRIARGSSLSARARGAQGPGTFPEPARVKKPPWADVAGAAASVVLDPTADAMAFFAIGCKPPGIHGGTRTAHGAGTGSTSAHEAVCCRPTRHQDGHHPCFSTRPSRARDVVGHAHSNDDGEYLPRIGQAHLRNIDEAFRSLFQVGKHSVRRHSRGGRASRSDDQNCSQTLTTS